MLCVLILYISDGTYSLKSTPNGRFFEKLFMAIFIYIQSFCQFLLRGNRRRNTFCILFLCLTWGSNLSFSSNKPTHYLLDHGDLGDLFYGNSTIGCKWSYAVKGDKEEICITRLVAKESCQEYGINFKETSFKLFIRV